MAKKNSAAAIREYKDARKALDKIGSRKPVDDDNRRYLAANQRVIDAEKNVSWWRR